MVAVPSIGRATEVSPRRGAPEADATRDLYERYARQIHAYCLQRLESREEAEDAVQSTFLNAFRGIQRGVDPEFEGAWLYKIAQNVCSTTQRSSSRRRRVETPGDLASIEGLVPAHQADSDELIRLPEALESMPQQQRKALLLREWQGLSYNEIADELELSQAAVETLLFRARRSLASGLVEAPERCALAGRRLRRSGDAGSLVAIGKSILFTGGTKLAATVATITATSVVAAAPATRHAVEEVVAPRHDAAPAVQHIVSPRPASVRRRVVAVSHVATPLSVGTQTTARSVPVAATHARVTPKRLTSTRHPLRSAATSRRATPARSVPVETPPAAAVAAADVQAPAPFPSPSLLPPDEPRVAATPAPAPELPVEHSLPPVVAPPPPVEEPPLAASPPPAETALPATDSGEARGSTPDSGRGDEDGHVGSVEPENVVTAPPPAEATEAAPPVDEPKASDDGGRHDDDGGHGHGGPGERPGK